MGAIHVATNRKIKERENRRRDIDEARSINSFILFDVRTGHNQNSKLSMPDSWAGRLARCPYRVLRAGFETVIGAKDDRRFRPGELEQSFQHHVVKTIGAADNLLVKLKSSSLPTPAWWDRPEMGRKMIHRVVINRVNPTARFPSAQSRRRESKRHHSKPWRTMKDACRFADQSAPRLE